MWYYEWKIKVDGQIWAQGTAPDSGGALDMMSIYLMQYQDDFENKLEIIIRRKK